MKSAHIIPLFELYNTGMEFKNGVKEVLAQYTFLSYVLKENPDDDTITICFNKDATPNYVAKILSSFQLEFLSKNPVSVKVIKKRNIEDFKHHANNKPVVGNIEEVSLPSIKLTSIEAKSDSGATTSTLHASVVEIHKDKKKVTFIALDKSHKQYTGQRYTSSVHELVRVQSSNGEHQVRPLIKLKIILKDKLIETFFTLTDRNKLEYPILLGKDLLSGYLIDASFV